MPLVPVLSAFSGLRICVLGTAVCGALESLHGSVYYPGPKADCVFGVLCDTGIYPDVRMLPLDKTYRFSMLMKRSATLSRNRDNLSEQKEILRAYITKTAKTDGPGIVLTGDSMLAKILWWSKALPDQEGGYPVRAEEIQQPGLFPDPVKPG
jgi:hypothetical protein